MHAGARPGSGPYRLPASLSFLLLLVVALAAPDVTAQVRPAAPSEHTVTRLVFATPFPGSTNVAINQTVEVTANNALDQHTVNYSSVRVTAGPTTLVTQLQVSLDKKTILIGFPLLMPPNTQITVEVDGGILKDHWGNFVDADLNGQPGGVGRGQFTTGSSSGVPPTQTGVGTVLGRVLTGSGLPLQGAIVRAWYAPRVEGIPPLPVPAGVSDNNGNFTYTTSPFAGQKEFLVEITRPGFSEILRRVTLLAGGCWRLDDAYLQPLSPPVTVQQATGGVLRDQTGEVSLAIPPGALQQTSNIRVTKIDNSNVIRERLPSLVAGGTSGFYLDVNGVFGERTNQLVTLRVPNRYNLPIGTQVPFGKVDHNTLQWTDLRNVTTPLPNGNPDPRAMGRVVSDGQGGTVIEVQFDEFCTVVCSYCNPITPPNPPGSPPGNPPPPNCGGGPGSAPGNSVIDKREGYLREDIRLPAFTEFGQPWGLTLGYFSGAAAPSATLRATAAYAAPNGRPVERTVFRFAVEGRTTEAVYDRTTNSTTPIATFFWDGRNGLGTLMPTGSYPYAMEIDTVNASVPVAVPNTFGGASVATFAATYPEPIQVRSAATRDRVVLLNYRGSAYGHGWSVADEHRLYIDADGCLVLAYDNGGSARYVPSTSVVNLWTSREGDFSTVTYDPASQTYRRTFDDGMVHTFNSAGRMTRKQNRFGHATVLTYASNRLDRITSPTGFFYQFTYDAAGKLSRIQDSAGRATNFVVDASGNLTRVTDAVGSVRTFQYDAESRMTGQVGERGERSEYSYDTGRVIRARAYDVQNGPLLRERQFASHLLETEITRFLARGLGTFGAPIPILTQAADVYTDGRGVASVTYTDVSGRVVRMDDGLGRQTRYSYDQNLLLSAVTRPDNSVTQFSYDARGNRTAVRQYLNGSSLYSTTSFEYQGAFQQLSRIVDAEGKQSVLTYNALGVPTTVANHLGQQLQMVYGDARFPQLPTQVSLPTGDLQRFTYDARGNVLTTTNFPDPVGQPAGRRWQFTYDAAGNVLTQVDPDNRTWTFQYDALGRRTLIRDPLLQNMTLSYADAGCGCSTGNLTRATFADNSSIAYRYDGLDRLVQQTDQRSRSTSFSYDAEGNLLLRTNRAGQAVAFEYDLAGQLVRKTLPGGAVTVFDYSPVGDLTSARDAVSRLDFTPDALGRVTSALAQLQVSVQGGLTTTQSYRLNYTYNRVGRLTRMTDDRGIVDQTYGYDDLHQLTSLGLPTVPNRSWTLAYDSAGRRTSMTRQGGPGTTWTYDSAGQMTAVLHASNPVTEFRYTNYDGQGRATASQLRVGTQTINRNHTYDAAGQLLSTADSQAFGESRVPIATTYGQAARVQSDNEYTYTFDDEGRMARRDHVGRPVYDTFTWDAEDRLRTVRQFYTGGTGAREVLTVAYAYDPLGRRFEKSVNGVVTRYAYDGDNLLLELDSGGRAVRHYVHGPVVDEVLAMRDLGQGTFHHLLGDRLFTPHALTDAAGAVVQTYLYDEYGQRLAESNPALFQPFAFTGREWDRELGFYHYRRRGYDPGGGRFTSEDPVGVRGSMNLYAYVDNNPVNLRDPYGLEPCNCVSNAYQRCMDANGPMINAGNNLNNAASCLTTGVALGGAGAALGTLVPGLGTTAGAIGGFVIGCAIGWFGPSIPNTLLNTGAAQQCRRVAEIDCAGQ